MASGTKLQPSLTDVAAPKSHRSTSLAERRAGAKRAWPAIQEKAVQAGEHSPLDITASRTSSGQSSSRRRGLRSCWRTGSPRSGRERRFQETSVAKACCQSGLVVPAEHAQACEQQQPGMLTAGSNAHIIAFVCLTPDQLAAACSIRVGKN